MDYIEIKKIILKLITHEQSVSSLEHLPLHILKAIGFQMALRCRHSKNKESVEANNYLEVLLQVRAIVKPRIQALMKSA